MRSYVQSVQHDVGHSNNKDITTNQNPYFQN